MSTSVTIWCTKKRYSASDHQFVEPRKFFRFSMITRPFSRMFVFVLSLLRRHHSWPKISSALIRPSALRESICWIRLMQAFGCLNLSIGFRSKYIEFMHIRLIEFPSRLRDSGRFSVS